MVKKSHRGDKKFTKIVTKSICLPNIFLPSGVIIHIQHSHYFIYYYTIMIFTAENILMVGSVLIFSGILISKTGYRFGIPTLLLFLLVGMGFGSDGLGLQFNSASDAQFIGMMALSIILFSGGMDTKYSDINRCSRRVSSFPPPACC